MAETGEVSVVEEPVKVLYISGAGHSGSTFLDLALGNDPEIQSVGEMEGVLQGGWLGDEYCGCCERVRECPFWSEVLSRWRARSGVSIEEYLGLQTTLTRFRHWPRLLKENVSPTRRFLEYAARTRELFEEIRTVGGRQVVVDSSKSPPRAYALSLMEGIDLRFIHLVRDGRGVTASYKKSWRRDLEAGVTRNVAPRSVLRTSAEWALLNLESELLARRLAPGKSLRIRYEDFVGDPERWMAKIARVTDLDLSSTARRIAAGELLSVGHNVAGNHVRMSPDLRLKPDAGRWRASLSERDQKLAWTFAGALLRRYGYER